jgi:cation diffusion facilitator CzcD-associated flavoprotein CzcO
MLHVMTGIRYLLAEQYFDKIDIFEQSSRVGGVWVHTPGADKAKVIIPVPQLNPHLPLDEPIWRDVDGHREATFVSPLYSGMETNIPKMIMEYAEKPFPAHMPLFPRAEQVLEYIKDYARDVEHLIHFQNQVQDVKIEDPSRSTWALTRKDLRSGQTSTDIYDAVVAANGHYSVPYVPAITGIESWNEAYPGVISHSKVYDLPEPFRNKKVIIVGNSASALDIGNQIARVCRKPIHAAQRMSVAVPPTISTHRVVHGEIVEFLSPTTCDRGVRFADGSTEDKIDAIVFCTGYFYAYPFLSSLNPPVVVDGSRALHVYQQMFYIEHPTLVFPVLPQRVTPFPLVENQAAVFARVWSGRLNLPSKAEMKAWEDSVVSEKGPGKAFHLLPYPLDAEYLNFLYDWAERAKPRSGLENDGKGRMGVRWGGKERWIRAHFPDIKQAFSSAGDRRHSIRTIEQLGFDPDSWKKELEGEEPLVSI